ncbi:MAG: hypothetical protein AAGB48_01615 [Planctomycetota bacterium]
MDTTKSVVAAALALAALPSLAQGLTVVNEPWTGEQSHADMLSSVLGGTFTSTGTVSGFNVATSGTGDVDVGLSNGSFTAMRVGDAAGSAAQLFSIGNAESDNVFGAGSYRAQIIGQNSSLDHEFGVVGQNGAFRSLLEGSSTESSMYHPGEEFTWAIRTSLGDQYSSDASQNDGRDHMVTYAIYDSNNNLFGAVLFFEDWGGQSSDWDYNDIGVLLTLAPTPNAALLGLAGLGGLGVVTGRRRR